MAHITVVGAVEDHLTENWERCPVTSPNGNLGEPPPDGSEFLMIQFPVANVDRWAVNEPYYREEGAVRFVLHVERGSGLTEGLGWADELAEMFRDTALGRVKFGVPTSPNLDDANDAGNYFVITFVAPYTYYYRA